MRPSELAEGELAKRYLAVDATSLDDQRCQAAVSRRQAGRQSRRAGTDDHDVPIAELAEVQVGVELGHFEIGHLSRPRARVLKDHNAARLSFCALPSGVQVDFSAAADDSHIRER